MRLYAGRGRAEFLCAGHPHHERAGADGDGHHAIVFVWAPGCVHIEDHDPPVLRGCDQGCDRYHLVAGDDPFAAELIEVAPEPSER